MERLESSLSRWLKDKGWRTPVRTVGEAAERLGTDSKTLYYYFERRVGMDFRTWRTRLRLEDAMRLLREEPDTPALDIAERVGFSNRSNFSRQFLAYTGLTPGQWRATEKKEPGCLTTSRPRKTIMFN
jgi:AraC-like DNA-binding protein